MNRLTHHEIQELLGAFALDAVDGEERDVVEAHLAGCPRCRGEVATHRETAALLAHPGDTAPEGVWARISAQLEEPPPEMNLGSVTVLEPQREEGRSRPLVGRRAAAIIGAVAAAVTGFFGWAIGQHGERLEGIEKRVSQLVVEDGLRRAAIAALGEPGAEQVRLESPDGEVGVHVVRLPSGTGFAVADRLAALPAERTYQLWAITADAEISLGVLGRDPDVAAFHATAPVLAYAITDEVAGGVEQPTREPVVAGFTERGGQAPGGPTPG